MDYRALADTLPDDVATEMAAEPVLDALEPFDTGEAAKVTAIAAGHIGETTADAGQPVLRVYGLRDCIGALCHDPDAGYGAAAHLSSREDPDGVRDQLAGWYDDRDGGDRFDVTWAVANNPSRPHLAAARDALPDDAVRSETYRYVGGRGSAVLDTRDGAVTNYPVDESVATGHMLTGGQTPESSRGRR